MTGSNRRSRRRASRRDNQVEHISAFRNVNPRIMPYKPLFPQKLKCQMKYTEFIGYSATSNWTYYLRANSLFDPNASGTGYQPMWFDNMKAIYNSYCVTASRIQVEVSNLSTSPARICLSPIDALSLPSLSFQQQLPYSSYAALGAGLSGNSIAYVETGINIAAFTGYTNPLDYALRSLVTTNPSTQVYYGLQIQSLDATTLSVAVTFVLVFDCEFLDLVPTYDA